MLDRFKDVSGFCWWRAICAYFPIDCGERSAMLLLPLTGRSLDLDFDFGLGAFPDLVDLAVGGL